MSIGEELKAFKLFSEVETADLEQLGRVMKTRTYPAGAVLFRKDDPGDAMFLVRSGRIRIFITDAQGNEITFRYYGPGQLVGEFALIDEKPRSASADAAEALEVLVLEREDFLTFLRQRPMLGVAMMRTLAERVRYTTTYLEKLFNAIQLLSNHEYEKALAEMSVSAGGEDDIQSLINAFLQMVHRLREREAALTGETPAVKPQDSERS